MIVELKDKPKENQIILLKFDSNKDTYDVNWVTHVVDLIRQQYPNNEVIGLIDVDFDICSQKEAIKILQKEIKKLRRKIRKEQENGR